MNDSWDDEFMDKLNKLEEQDIKREKRRALNAENRAAAPSVAAVQVLPSQPMDLSDCSQGAAAAKEDDRQQDLFG